MNKKYNIYSIVFGILLLITLISGGTLAVYTWQTISEDEDIIEGKSNCFTINYVKGNDIGSNENVEKLTLGSKYTDGLSTTIKIGIAAKCEGITGIGTLYLNTEDDTSDYLIDNKLLNYQVVLGTTKVKSGVINTKNSIPIYEDFTINNTEKSLTVYVWINGANVTEDNLDFVLNSVYKGNITATAESR